MVQIQEPESEFLNGKYCYKKQIRRFKIVNEAKYVDSKDFDGNPVQKLEALVEFPLPEGNTQKKWQPNKKAVSILQKIFGTDTKSMIGKTIKINLDPYKESYSIVVDEMDTISLNKPIGI